MSPWRDAHREVRNGVWIRTTALFLMAGLFAMAIGILRTYPKEAARDDKGAPVLILIMSALLFLLGAWTALSACLYRLRVSRDGIEKREWWGKRHLTWDNIASCRRVTRTQKDRSWTALLMLDPNDNLIMETAPPFMGTIAYGFAEEYEAALRLAERFLTERLRYGILHEQRLDEIRDGSLDHDLRPWPETPYTREPPTVSRETSSEMKPL